MTTIYPGMTHTGGNPVVAIDFETTGTVAGYHEIIQVGAILLDGDLRPNTEVRPFYHNIAPVYPERAQRKATIVHGLNLSDLALNAPSNEKVADLLVEWFEALKLPQNKRLVPLAHNWVFEYSFSNAWLGNELHEYIYHFHTRDGMLLALALKDRAALAGKSQPFRYVGLSKLCTHFGIVNENPHDALCDAKAGAEVYRALLKHELS